MAQRIPKDHNYYTTCPASIKAKITQLEAAAMEYAFCGAREKEDREHILHGAQVARYNLEQTILTCVENAVAEAHQAVRRHAAYHMSEVKGCLDEYEDMPCKSLMDRLRSAVNKAKETFNGN